MTKTTANAVAVLCPHPWYEFADSLSANFMMPYWDVHYGEVPSIIT